MGKNDTRGDEMVTLLFCAGELSDASLTAIASLSPDCVIGVDAGADIASEVGLDVDIVIGDLDSVRHTDYEPDKLHQIESQNNSDLAKALDYCSAQSWRDIIIVGIDGGRADHALAIWATLATASSELRIEMYTYDSIAYRATSKCSVELGLRRSTTFSVFGLAPPPEESAATVTLSGGEWSFEKEKLPFSSRGLSNRSIEDVVTLSTNGVAVIIAPISSIIERK